MNLAVHGLLVDDQLEQAELIEKLVAREFGDFGWIIEWVICGSALQARMEIAQRRRHGEPPFDFAIVEYDLGMSQPSGSAVVKDLREQSEDTFILVISGSARHHPNFQEVSINAGANAAINRGVFLVLEHSEWTAKRFVDLLRGHISELRDTHSLRVTFAPDDPGLHATLYSLGSLTGKGDPVGAGRKIVRQLVIASLPPSSRSASATFEVRHLAPGRSGAYVCRVDRVEGGTAESFVLKIGLDRQSLEHERVMNDYAQRALPGILMRVDGPAQSHRSGYAAISSRFAENTVTLADWLGGRWTSPESRPVAISDVHSVADILYNEQLARLLDPERGREEDISTWLRLSPVLVLRAYETIAAYEEVWGHPDGGGRSDAATLAAMLRDFVEAGTLPGVAAELLAGKTWYADGFGDLHSKNVLVETGGGRGPLLVDASLYGAHHWAADVARLLVDLVLRVRRPGAPAMIWRDFAEDCAYTQRLCSQEDRPAPDESDLVDVFISHVLQNLATFRRLYEIHLPVPSWHWQWHVALAMEFVRQGTAGDLAPPRVVLALTSTVYHLRFAAELINEVDYG